MRWFPVVLALIAAALVAPAARASSCVGDCDGNGVVDDAELHDGIDLALGRQAATCAAIDRGADGVVDAADLVAAVATSLRGCRLVDCAFAAGALPATTLPAGTPLGTQIPIDHVIVMMQENRSFDHYFGTMPGVDGLPPDASNPHAGGQPVAAWHDERTCIPDCNHEWNGSHVSWDGGLNDGFVIANDPGGERAMGYHEEAELPFYRALAASYAISDRYFCSLLGPTFPNRYFLYCGTAFGKASNDVPFLGWTQKTIFDVLDQHAISWRIYYSDIAFGQAFRHLRGNSHVVTIGNFYSDAASGHLPSVAFIDPKFTGVSSNATDEHPPSNIQRGQQFVAGVVAAVTASPQWASTALFVTYDEHGGLYDHVPPPPACEPDATLPALSAGDMPGRYDRLGFRVPFIVVSPWARPGYVSHRVHDHASILRFIETRFALPAMTARDANAQALLDLFDFSEPPLLAPPTLPAATLNPDLQQQCVENGF